MHKYSNKSLSPDPYQQRLAQMRPEEKLELSLQLYESARLLKTSALRAFHPEWSEMEIAQEVGRIFADAIS